MKPLSVFTLLFFALTCGAKAAPVHADTPKALDSETKNPSNSSRGNAKWASFIPRDVETVQGDDLGTVTDLAIDMKNGRIAAVVVTTKNFHGRGTTKSVGVPPGAFVNFKEGGEHGTLKLNTTKKRFDAAPELTGPNWYSYFQSSRFASVFLSFGVAPYFETGRKGSDTQDMSLGLIISTQQILGLPVHEGNKVMGKVSAIRVDAQSERVMYVLVYASKAISGQSEIMASEVQLNTARNGLIFDVTKQGDSAFRRPVGGTDSPRAAKSAKTQTDYPATVP